jgi:hypothetical protein
MNFFSYRISVSSFDDFREFCGFNACVTQTWERLSTEQTYGYLYRLLYSLSLLLYFLSTIMQV